MQHDQAGSVFGERPGVIFGEALTHLMQCSRALALRLILIAPNGTSVKTLLRPRLDESWEQFVRRRLATPIRRQRIACDRTQKEVADIVGVSHHSIQRWELAYVRSRPIAHIVWAQAHDFLLGLELIHALGRTPRRVSRAHHVHSGR